MQACMSVFSASLHYAVLSMQYLFQTQDEYPRNRGKFHTTRIRCYSPTPQPPPTGGEGGYRHRGFSQLIGFFPTSPGFFPTWGPLGRPFPFIAGLPIQGLGPCGLTVWPWIPEKLRGKPEDQWCLDRRFHRVLRCFSSLSLRFHRVLRCFSSLDHRFHRVF